VAPRFFKNPDWIVHCTSALAPLLYEQIAVGRRKVANAAPLEGAMLRKIYPRCHNYIPDGREDKSRYTCTCGYSASIHPATAPDGPICPRCTRRHGKKIKMTEDPAGRLESAGKCKMYMEPGDPLRGVCPFVSRDVDGSPAADFTDRQGSHDLFRVLLDTPERFVRDLRAEHEALIGTEIKNIDGTYVGVDWRE